MPGEAGRGNGAGIFDYDGSGDLDLVTAALNPVAGGDELHQNTCTTALSHILHLTWVMARCNTFIVILMGCRLGVSLKTTVAPVLITIISAQIHVILRGNSCRAGDDAPIFKGIRPAILASRWTDCTPSASILDVVFIRP